MSGQAFASVYDALYGDPAFLQVQLSFLRSVFGSLQGPLLDLGCGTGSHLAALVTEGYSVAGVDVDTPMLRCARGKAPQSSLLLGDLRRLPFARAFRGALCLESPLAYLLDDADLAVAFRSIRGVLCEGAKLVVDVYDYPGTLGTRRVRPQETRFETENMRVKVRESHRYAKQSRIWTMRQEFEVEETGEAGVFEILHRLRMRTMDEYAQALEGAGFTVLQALTAYPDTPESLRHERRVILVARG